MPDIQVLKVRVCKLEECLRAMRDYRPSEICYDEFAYKRLLQSYREAARNGLRRECTTKRDVT